jgi:pilus assembly protein Flp/PilA
MVRFDMGNTDMIRTAFAAAAAAVKDRKGVTAAEYAVLATGIVLAVGLAASALGTKISGIFGQIGAPPAAGG